MAGALTTNTALLCIGLGLVAGIFSATFGVGSGVIVVPALTLIAAIPQKEAQGLALVIMVPMALMGAYRYHINPDIHLDYKIAALVGITAIIGVNIGATLIGYVTNKQLQFGFSCFLFIVGIRMMIDSLSSTS